MWVPGGHAGKESACVTAGKVSAQTTSRSERRFMGSDATTRLSMGSRGGEPIEIGLGLEPPRFGFRAFAAERRERTLGIGEGLGPLDAERE